MHGRLWKRKMYFIDDTFTSCSMDKHHINWYFVKYYAYVICLKCRGWCHGCVWGVCLCILAIHCTVLQSEPWWDDNSLRFRIRIPKIFSLWQCKTWNENSEFHLHPFNIRWLYTVGELIKYASYWNPSVY